MSSFPSPSLCLLFPFPWGQPRHCPSASPPAPAVSRSPCLSQVLQPSSSPHPHSPARHRPGPGCRFRPWSRLHPWLDRRHWSRSGRPPRRHRRLWHLTQVWFRIRADHRPLGSFSWLARLRGCLFLPLILCPSIVDVRPLLDETRLVFWRTHWLRNVSLCHLGWLYLSLSHITPFLVLFLAFCLPIFRAPSQMRHNHLNRGRKETRWRCLRRTPRSRMRT